MAIIKNETAGVIYGVPGRFMNVVRWHNENGARWSGRIANQRWVSQRRKTKDGTELQVEIRFDDNCKNGHESFAITATEYERGRDIAGGCMHEDIAKVFPELSPLIKWHLTSTDGPMHYVANVLWHAGNRDCWGLLLGERRYSDKTMLHAKDAPAKYDWQEKYRRVDEGEDESAWRRWLPIDMIDPNSDADGFEMKQLAKVSKIGEGTDRDLDAARRVAIWPEATDDELKSDKFVLTKLLEARLPTLVAEFRETMEKLGFVL